MNSTTDNKRTSPQRVQDAICSYKVLQLGRNTNITAQAQENEIIRTNPNEALLYHPYSIPANGICITALVPHGNVTAQLEQLQDAVLCACGNAPISAMVYPLQPLFCPLEAHALQNTPTNAKDGQSRAMDWKNLFLAKEQEECQLHIPVLYPPIFINDAIACPIAINLSSSADQATYGKLHNTQQNITSAVQLAFLSGEKLDKQEKTAIETAVRQAAENCLFPAQIPLRVFRIQTLEITRLPESTGIKTGWMWNQTAELWIKLQKKRPA